MRRFVPRTCHFEFALFFHGERRPSGGLLCKSGAGGDLPYLFFAYVQRLTCLGYAKTKWCTQSKNKESSCLVHAQNSEIASDARGGARR